MSVLVGLLVHDRPELLAACLKALKGTLRPEDRLYIHADAPDKAVEQVLAGYRPQRSTLIVSSENVGAAVGTNLILRDRKPGEHFCQLASDVLVSEDWLADLEWFMVMHDFAAVSPIWLDGKRPDRRDTSRFGADEAWRTIIPCSGANLIHADWCDRIGAWRSYGTYGREDLDYFWRIHYAGGNVSYCPTVEVENMDAHYQGTPGYKRKQQAIEATKWEWKRNRDRYEQGHDLHQPFPWEKA